MWKKHPDETDLDIGLMKQAWILFLAYRSRECINETAFLLITDQSHQSLWGFFSDAQGQLTPQSVVESG